MNKLPKLILASNSPRRAEILESVGWEFEKHVADIDESVKKGESPAVYVQRLAREKAAAVAQNFPGKIVLGADTTVVVDDQIIGKPVDKEDARRMLKLLSGKWHEVLTGVALLKVLSTDQDSKIIETGGVESTRVKFSPLNNEEIEFLIDFGAPLDKAGAYAVQAQAALFIEKLKGDYWNVVGLPVNLLYKILPQVL